MIRIFTLLFLITGSFQAFSQSTGPGKISSTYNNRIALVIGNSSYPAMPLRNPANDANAISTELKNAGFDVISYTDLDRRGMRSAIREFGEKINESKGVGLFYYAGHGLQSQGINYLVPTDADIQYEYEIEDMCVRADQVLRMLEINDNPLNIIIIDACRNNPYGSRFRSMGQGLAIPETAPVGTIIAFATAPGKTASDGDGANGLYTQELIKAMKTPGLSIEQMFKEVRINVLQESNERQSPWENSSLTGNFYFYPAESTVKRAVVSNTGGNEYYDFKRVRFFESDGNATESIFGNEFNKSTTRYVNAQIDFVNKQYGKSDWVTNFKFKFYKPSGILWTDLSPDKTVSSDMKEGDAHSGWGWSIPGYWAGGKYKVEVWDGSQLLGEDYFEIVGNTRDNYQLTAIDFFNYGDAAKTPTTEFDLFESRYIGTKLSFNNKRNNQGNWVCSFSARYFKPDGTYLGDANLSKEVTSDETTVTVSNAWGYENIGYWAKGSYKVEIWDGDDKVAEKSFNVVDDRENIEGNYVYQTIGFYESDAEGELGEIKKEFNTNDTRYVNTQIKFINLNYGKQDWLTDFNIKYFHPDGKLWTDIERDVNVSKDLEYAYVFATWGYDNPGSWIPGEYKVEVWEKDHLLGTDSFVVPTRIHSFRNMVFHDGTVNKDNEITYTNEFEGSNTTYVHIEVNCRNFKFGIEDWTSDLKVKYFFPSGDLFGEFPINTKIPKDLDFFYVTRSYGYPEPGNWMKGDYKVEVWNETELLGTGQFTIR